MRFLPVLFALVIVVTMNVRVAVASPDPVNDPVDDVVGEVTVHRLSIEGVKAVSADRLKSVLATRQSPKLFWGRKRYFDPRALEADLARIHAFYTDRGYPDARVVSSIVTPNARKTAVDIVITVAEGEPVRVAEIRLEGFDSLPPEGLARVRDDIPLRVGRPRDRAVVVASHDRALDELRDRGYPYAKVTTSEVPGPEDGTTTVVISAEPGVLAHFGPIEIGGQTSVGENIIRRELDYAPGDLYRRSLLLNTQRRLYGLALFQFVNVAAVPSEEQTSPEVPTKVLVKEGKHQLVNAGVGYGSEEKWRTDLEYRHVNFLGGARTAGVHGRFSSLDRGIRGDFVQPYFFRPHVSLGVEAQDWLTFTTAYKSVTQGARVAVTHRSSPRWSLAFSLTNEFTSSTIADEFVGDPALYADLIAIGLDPTTGKQEGTLSALGTELQRTITDDPIDPHRGYTLSLRAEEAGVLLPGSFNYYALFLEGRHYQPLGDDLVIATRVQIGNIGPIGSGGTNVPFSKKYFLGGATTLRGWGRYEVSPLSSTGVPIGGNSVLAMSAEGRRRLRKSLGGVLFLDAGNVWPGSTGLALNDLYYDLGAGLRYNTKVGPIRLDVAYQLNQVPGLLDSNGNPQTGRWRFYFSVGQAF